MKIGLLTIHDTKNYGSLAQTIGTYKALKLLGLDVELIDYKCQAIYNREYEPFSCNWRKPLHFINWLLTMPQRKQKLVNYQKVLRSECKMSPQWDRTTITEANNRYDAFIVGSDIVWGFKITGHDLSYMLDFVPADKLKVAFSASVGDNWLEEDRPKVKELLSQFMYISTREQQASEWVNALINKDIPVTCDPTTLFDMKFWSQYKDDSILPKSKYILTYMGPDNKQDIKDALAYGKAHHLPVYAVRSGFKQISGVKIIMPMNFGQWISLLTNAEMTFTGSFHGMMYSLYFHRNFFFYGRGHSNSRLESIAKVCNVAYRLGTAENIKANTAIDWDYVDKALQEKREESFEYLKNTFNIKA